MHLRSRLSISHIYNLNLTYFKRTFHTSFCGLKGLDILFFGSDEFSRECFRSVDDLAASSSSVVHKLEVVTRPPKRNGRDRSTSSQTVEVPLAPFARERNRTVHFVETKQDFENIQTLSYDLLVVVSYGKLIPAQLITRTKYGGINLHPSLLPRHSGAAPLQAAILDNDEFSGVTIQTLHPTQFDRGSILMQSLPVRLSLDETSKSLGQRLSKVGADMLREFLKTLSEYIDKHPNDEGPEIVIDSFKTNSEEIRLLPRTWTKKIDSRARHINWATDSASTIERKWRAFGLPLWTEIRYFDRHNQTAHLSRRAILEDITIVDNMGSIPSLEVGSIPNLPGQYLRLGPGKQFFAQTVVRTCDGKLLLVQMKQEKVRGKSLVDSDIFDLSSHK
ncbi:formyl transferase [Lipomyces oligophaga]|uniref:formyl transferase n=1 Tax=Lipomyces oligophaga TaxID=45792 RepID=UPI0034CF7BF8